MSPQKLTILDYQLMSYRSSNERRGGLSGKLTALLLVAFLCSCETVPPAPSTTPEVATSNVQSLLEEAYQSAPPVRQQLMLQAAVLLNQGAELEDAATLLDAINTGHFSDTDFADYTILYSEIALQQDSPFLAQRILSDNRVDRVLKETDPKRQSILIERRADLYITLGEPEASIDQRIQLSPLLDSEDQQLNHDRLWHALQSLPSDRLSTMAATAPDDVTEGWYELALTVRNNQESLDRQQSAIESWQKRWLSHPGSVLLPSGLILVEELIEKQPAHLAVLLPQSGPLEIAANAIRDGFMAAYYSAAERQSGLPELRFYDSADSDMVTLFQQAIDQGAQAVIGPLGKDKVTDLALYNALPIPTLAFNYASEVTNPASNLFQLGLSSEDEARQVAQRAWLEGHRVAIIYHDQASWGERTASAFRMAWEALGGSVVTQSSFSSRSNFSQLIEQSLEIDRSKSRWKRLQQTLASTLNFEPRRRQDADFIFLIAKPAQARQIKPALAFHYASELSVYSTSRVYDGSGDPSKNRDLDGIRFVTMPWLFDKSSPVKISIDKFASPAPSLNQLYALGADAFKLYPRLPQLESLPDTQLYGLTGSLTMTDDREIKRQLVWAEMAGGKPKPLSSQVNEFKGI